MNSLKPPGSPATHEDILRIESKIDRVIADLAQLAQAKPLPAVINRTQAKKLAGCTSDGQFDNWLPKYAPFARVRHGRFSRSRIEIGVARELQGVKSIQQ